LNHEASGLSGRSRRSEG